MRIFLTGARGMVGRNILESTHASGHEVWAPKRSELDLCQSADVTRAVCDFRPDLIIHAAGRVGGIAANVAAPYEFLSENLEMGKNLVAAAREHDTPRFLNFSSSCIYPKEGFHPLKEEHILQGPLEPTNEGYALAKLTVMRLGEFAARGGILSFKSLIPCNLYGRHDHFDPLKSHLLPSIVMKVHRAKSEGQASIEVWGSGEARREFMYAGDLAEVTWQAVERFAELPVTMNVGVGHDHSVNDYYRAAAAVIGWQGHFLHDLTRPEGMKQKLVDNSRMRHLGLAATTSLEEGIRRTHAFYVSLSGA